MLPSKLKYLNLFNEGASYIGEVASVKLPILSKKVEEYRSGGMIGPVKVVMGLGAIDMEWKAAGYMRDVIRQHGVTDVAGLGLRFAGSYERGDGSGADAVEIVVRGFHEEIDRGDAKSGEDTEFSVKTACSYYKEIINGVVELEIDLVNMIWIVAGVDVLVEHRANLGI